MANKNKQKTRSAKSHNSSDSEPELGKLEELTQTIRELTRSVEFMANVLEDMKTEIKELRRSSREEAKERETMKERIRQLEEAVDRNERERIKNNIIITGIDKQEGRGGEEKTSDVVESVLKGMHVKIEKGDIISCKRKEGRHDHSPIAVELSSKDAKEKILIARRKVRSIKTDECGLKGDVREIYINEQLTALKTNLFYQARQIKKDKKYKFVWTREGNVYMRKMEDEKKIHIKNVDDLERIN